MPKTPTELAKDAADLTAAALKDQILKLRPTLHEPSKFRRGITDKMTEMLNTSTEEFKDGLRQMKSKGADSYMDWIASMMSIMALAQSLNMKLSLQLWHKQIPIIDIIAQGVNALGDKIRGKKVDVKITSDIDQNGIITINADIPEDMEKNDDANDAFKEFEKTTADVYKAILEENDLFYTPNPNEQLAFNPNAKVTARMTAPNKMVFEVGGQQLDRLQAEKFMKDNAPVFSRRMKEVHNKHVELDVSEAPRLR